MKHIASYLKLMGGAVLTSATLLGSVGAQAQGVLACDGATHTRSINPGSLLTATFAVNADDVVSATFSGDTSQTTGSIFEGPAAGSHAATPASAPAPTPDPRLGVICGALPAGGPAAAATPACTSLSLTAVSTTTITLQVTKGPFRRSHGATPATPAAPVGVSFSCAPAATDTGDTSRTSAGGAAGGASTNSIGGGINNAVGNRFGSGGNIDASRSHVFLSTRGEDTPLVFWTSLEGRSFDGGVNGSGVELTLGADIELTPDLILGGILSWGDYDMTVGANTVNVDGLTIGAYVAQRLSATSTFDAYLTYSEPDYLISGTAYTAERWAGAAKMSIDYSLASVDVRSFGSVAFLREEHPAATIAAVALGARQVSSVTGSLGSKATYTTASPWTPYASLAADFTIFDDGVSGSTTNVSPRIGLGASYDTGTSTFQVDFDAGEPFKGTRDYGVRLRYEFRF